MRRGLSGATCASPPVPPAARGPQPSPRPSVPDALGAGPPRRRRTRSIHDRRAREPDRTGAQMTQRPELLDATDEIIDDAVKYADPMVLRGLLYQLTGDQSLQATEVMSIQFGFLEA